MAVFNKLYVKDAYIDTTIVDDSIVNPVEAALPKKLTILQPIFASKGKANTILDFDSSSLVKSAFGSDMENLNLYGQGGINIIHAMGGGASAEVCRLLPDNAETAAILVSLQVEENDEIPVYVRNTDRSYKYVDGERVQATTEDGKKITCEGLKVKILIEQCSPTDDAVGKIPMPEVAKSVTLNQGEENESVLNFYRQKIPLFKLVYNGPGKCGNNIGFTIENDSARDDMVTDGRRYILKLWEKDSLGNTNSYGTEFYFSLNPDARLTEGAEVFENLQYVFTDTDDAGNERELFCKAYIMDNFDKLNGYIAKYSNPVFADSTGAEIDYYTDEQKEYLETDPLKIDILNLQDTSGAKYDQFVFDEDTATFGSDVVHFMEGGSDGSLQEGWVRKYKDPVTGADKEDAPITAEQVESMKESLLMNFFNCQVDPSIFDERLTPCDILFDANYSFSNVKPVMLGKFRDCRPDIMVIADIGTDSRNCTQGLNLLKAIYGMVDGSKGYSAACIVHHGYTTDRALPLLLTGTYDYSYGLAKCYGALGTFSVFAGYQNGRVQTQKFEWLPYKDEFDTMIGQFRKAGCIYAQELFRGIIAYMGEENMYTHTYSKLKSIRNGMVIGDAVRLSKDILIKYVYDNDGAEAALTKAATEFAERLAGRYPKNITVTPTLYRTERDKMLENSSCDLDYYFPGMTKAWNLKITAKRADS